MRTLTSGHAETQLDPGMVDDLCSLTSAFISIFDAPQHGRGRPRSSKTNEQAERVSRCLLLNGRFDAYGQELSSRVRRMLEEGVASGVLRKAGERKLLYSVDPRLQRIRHALAGTILPKPSRRRAS
jgi:hypothetical protein